MNFPGGAVYTKQWVVELMLDLIGYKCDEDLSTKKILEPSCGHGAFLISIVKRLCNSAHKYNTSIEKMQNCILATDIDEKSISICKNNIMEILINEGYTEAEATILTSSWINSTDFLLSSYNKFDYVIGNPPYIRSDDLPKKIRQTYSKKLNTVTLGTDLYVGFIENGLRSLSKDGKLCYICADRWMQNKYGSRLREFVSNNYNVELICRMHEVDAFESEVSAYPAITIISNGKQSKCNYIVCSSEFGPNDTEDLKQQLNNQPIIGKKITSTEISINGKNPWPLSNSENIEIVEKLRALFPKIEDCDIKIGIGIATGKDDVFITSNQNLVESERMIPLIKKEDINEGLISKNTYHWLINPWDDDGKLVELDEYPLMRNYLESNSESLKKRHIAKKNLNKWYRTIDKVNPLLLSKPKLLMQDLSKYPDPYYDEGKYYPSHNMYWITSDTWDLKVLGGILMSEHIESFIDTIGIKMRGNTMRCQAQYLRMLHIPNFKDLNNTEIANFKKAFENRDRNMATTCMDQLLNRRANTYE